MDYYYSGGSASSASNTSASKLSTKKKKGATGSVKLSTDPQSVAARERRHRISDRFKTLQSLVPGGAKMDTVTMLDEAIHYVKFLKTQIWLHQAIMGSLAAPGEYQNLNMVGTDACLGLYQQQLDFTSQQSFGESPYCYSPMDAAVAVMSGQAPVFDRGGMQRVEESAMPGW